MNKKQKGDLIIKILRLKKKTEETNDVILFKDLVTNCMYPWVIHQRLVYLFIIFYIPVLVFKSY